MDSVAFATSMRRNLKTKWRIVLFAMLRIAVALHTRCAQPFGTSSCKYRLMFQNQMCFLPVDVEFLRISEKDHDVNLVRFEKDSRGSVFPSLYEAVEASNLLYIFWTPFSDKVYAGRTTCLIERRRQRFCRIADNTLRGQIPAYEVIRLSFSHIESASVAFFMLPVVIVPGHIPVAIRAESVSEWLSSS